jgi:hypothetical protein
MLTATVSAPAAVSAPVRVVSSPTVGICPVAYRYLVHAETTEGRDRDVVAVDVLFTLADLPFYGSLAHHRLVNRLVRAAMPGYCVPLKDGWVVVDNSGVPF